MSNPDPIPIDPLLADPTLASNDHDNDNVAEDMHMDMVMDVEPSGPGAGEGEEGMGLDEDLEAEGGEEGDVAGTYPDEPEGNDNDNEDENEGGLEGGDGYPDPAFVPAIDQEEGEGEEGMDLDPQDGGTPPPAGNINTNIDINPSSPLSNYDAPLDAGAGAGADIDGDIEDVGDGDGDADSQLSEPTLTPTLAAAAAAARVNDEAAEAINGDGDGEEDNDDDDSGSSITSSTLPLSEVGDGEADAEADAEGDAEIDPTHPGAGAGADTTPRRTSATGTGTISGLEGLAELAAATATAGTTGGTGAAGGEIGDDGSDLTEFEEEDEEDEEDGEGEDGEEGAEAGSDSGDSDNDNDDPTVNTSVPPPSSSTRTRRPTIIAAANASASSSNALIPPTPIANRKPSIFGNKPLSVDGDAEGEGEGEDEDALTDIDESDAESDIPAASRAQTPKRRGGDHPLATQIKIINASPNGTKTSPSGIGIGVDHDLENPYKPMVVASTPTTNRPSMVPGITLTNTEANNEDDEPMTDEEEEEDAAAGTMLQKDVARRESEGKMGAGVGGKGGKGKGKGGGRGKSEEVERVDRENTEDSRLAEPVEASPARSKKSTSNSHHQTHPSLLSNLSSATSQQTLEALQALLQIEIKFAALRDQLYVERMNELTREEEVIVDGTHPSLLHLHQILSDRRENLLRLSELRLKQNELELVRVRDWDKYSVMSWWQDAKDSLIQTEYESNARKKRKLDKDKGEIETVKPRNATPAPKPLPPIIPTMKDAEIRMFAWEKGSNVTALTQDEVASDLAKIGVAARQQYRMMQGQPLQSHRHMPGYSRNGSQVPQYTEQEILALEAQQGGPIVDASGRHAINGAHHHHHHHHLAPAAGPSRHRHYSQQPNTFGESAGGSGGQPRREGRQVPTSSADPFETRKRERMDDAGSSRDRRNPYDEARDAKRRKTDSPALNGIGGYPSGHIGHQPRDGDPRLRRSLSPTSKKAATGQQLPSYAADPGPPVNGAGMANGYAAGQNGAVPGWPYRGAGAGAAGVDHRKALMPGMAAARN